MMNKDQTILMGIDGGTGGIRVGLYDIEGHCLGFSSRSYETKFPKPGYAMQDPDDWWDTMAAAIKDVLNTTGIDKHAISALAFDSTCTSVVFARKDGTPLYPCIIWMDVRAAKEAEELLDKTGEFYSPEWMPPKLAWFKRNERKLYDETEVFCGCGLNMGPGVMCAYYFGKPLSKNLEEERKLLQELIEKNK